MIRKTTLIFFYLSAFFCGLSAQSSEGMEDTPEMPYFSGCEAYADYSDEKRNCSNQTLIDFISRNLVYPEQAQTDDIEGTVYVRFSVSETGKVTNAKVLNQIGGGCDEEALRVVNMFPSWDHPESVLKPAAVEMDLPVLFALKSVEPVFSEREILLTATVVEDGEFVEVARLYQIID